MTPEAVPISPTAHRALLELAARTGRPEGELLDSAVQALRLKFTTPIDSIPGVDPADVRVAAEADAGRLVGHDELFAPLRARK